MKCGLPSLRAKRGNSEANAVQSGLPRCARNDGFLRAFAQRVFQKSESITKRRHAELVSASMPHYSCENGTIKIWSNIAAWTLKQVKGDGCGETALRAFAAKFMLSACKAVEGRETNFFLFSREGAKAQRLTSWFLGALAMLIAAPTVACSGPSTQGHAYESDVIVTGTLIDVDKTLLDEIVTKEVIKGVKADRYIVEWGGVDYAEECAFLSPLYRGRGVYFLKRNGNGKYLIMWTEKRWQRRWKTEP